jgi:putative aminopeptidase FrvX
MNFFDYISEFSAFVSPAGNEREIGRYISKRCKALGAEVSSDRLGNIIARKEGGGKKLMLCAHMDTTGLMATFIEPSGHVRFARIGGLNHEDILYTPVVFQNGARGIIAKDDAAKKDELSLSNLFIDLGAKSEKEARKLVSTGDRAAFSASPFVSQNRAFSPYMDNRAGVAVLLCVLEGLKDFTNDLYFVFSAQEEVGLRGARTAAFAINPDYAIAVDVTATGDNPDPKPKMALRLGDGPAVKIMDRSIICHPEVVQAIEHCAGQESIPLQREVLEFGGTDAGAIHVSREGVKTGGISLPARYIHSPTECVDLEDAQNAIKLIDALLKEGI